MCGRQVGDCHPAGMLPCLNLFLVRNYRLLQMRMRRIRTNNICRQAKCYEIIGIGNEDSLLSNVSNSLRLMKLNL